MKNKQTSTAKNKILMLGLALIMGISLVGCGESDQTPKQNIGTANEGGIDELIDELIEERQAADECTREKMGDGVICLGENSDESELCTSTRVNAEIPIRKECGDKRIFFERIGRSETFTSSQCPEVANYVYENYDGFHNLYKRAKSGETGILDELQKMVDKDSKINNMDVIVQCSKAGKFIDNCVKEEMGDGVICVGLYADDNNPICTPKRYNQEIDARAVCGDPAKYYKLIEKKTNTSGSIDNCVKENIKDNTICVGQSGLGVNNGICTPKRYNQEVDVRINKCGDKYKFKVPE